jgi:hypothetical protein
MSEVSTFRLYLLRAMYVFTVVGFGDRKLPALLHPATLSPGDSVILSVLGATALLAVVGIRYPIKMLPLLFFEFVWKAIWILLFGLPLFAFRWAGSERKLRGDGNADRLHRGRGVGSAGDALGLRARTLFEGARRSVGQAGNCSSFRVYRP